jgi:hypothetical protein
MPDADGVGDHLGINYTDYADIYLPDGYWEFSVRRLDVERWERLYPALAEPPPAPTKEPTPFEKYKRYTTDDDLVVEGVNGIESRTWSNPLKAAKALADRAEGSSHASTVDRLRKKIRKKIRAALEG